MQLYLLYLQIIPTFVPIKSNPIINKTSTAVMKKKTILFASCLLGALAFSSCEKNLSPPACFLDSRKQSGHYLSHNTVSSHPDYPTELTHYS